jgi:hypothetical protein
MTAIKNIGYVHMFILVIDITIGVNDKLVSMISLLNEIYNGQLIGRLMIVLTKPDLYYVRDKSYKEREHSIRN